jgi:surface antigen
MKRTWGINIAIITAAALALSACAGAGGLGGFGGNGGKTGGVCSGGGTKTFLGTALGAGIGGFAGNQIGGGGGKTIATVAGVILGGLAGNSAGNSLDKADCLAMNQTANRALEKAPTGVSTAWRNPNTGNAVTVTPTRTYQLPSRRFGAPKQYCREYQTEITVGGKTKQMIGKACRNPDGSWTQSR